MSDIRLEEARFEFGGKEYALRCNMNVLADVQEEYNGKLGKAIFDPKRTDRAVMCFLAAMMNDYADEQGWEERFTTRGLGRKLSPKEVPKLVIVKLVADALFTKKKKNEPDKTEGQATEEDSKK